MIRVVLIALLGVSALGCSHRLEERQAGINPDAGIEKSRMRNCRNPDEDLLDPVCSKERSPSGSKEPVPMPPYGNSDTPWINESHWEYCAGDADCPEGFAVEPNAD